MPNKVFTTSENNEKSLSFTQSKPSNDTFILQRQTSKMKDVEMASSSGKVSPSEQDHDQHRTTSKYSRLNQPLINIDSLIKRFFYINNQFVREFLSEMFGTTLLVLFGCASVAEYKLRKTNEDDNPILLTINLTFGFGITLAVLITSKSSGGHLNPAISFASLLIGKMSLLRFIIYVLAQFLGAFIGACLVYFTYMDAFKNVKNLYTQNFAEIFCTYPHDNLTTLGGVTDQTVGTFLLVIVFLTMVDRRNNSHEDGLNWTTVAFTMGIAVSVIGMSLGYNSAYAINPARDFSPRFFAFIAGWGSQVFTAYDYFFWIPLVIPMVGAFLATICYSIFINNSRQV